MRRSFGSLETLEAPLAVIDGEAPWDIRSFLMTWRRSFRPEAAASSRLGWLFDCSRKREVLD
jgi:hypothetical protein